ncbi:hypothetical protein PHPALM_31368 [Phytophthora palmivora]|uniref:Uncharacterized protein n=1 Tax=Phytophthora palmivora TaxID=4796 RepID=A0A2P4X2S1_9STRA|nr:hypothetical protein PHPALM_31368 [Phytophthora palmivora]
MTPIANVHLHFGVYGNQNVIDFSDRMRGSDYADDYVRVPDSGYDLGYLDYGVLGLDYVDEEWDYDHGDWGCDCRLTTRLRVSTLRLLLRLLPLQTLTGLCCSTYCAPDGPRRCGFCYDSCCGWGFDYSCDFDVYDRVRGCDDAASDSHYGEMIDDDPLGGNFHTNLNCSYFGLVTAELELQEEKPKMEYRLKQRAPTRLQGRDGSGLALVAKQTTPSSTVRKQSPKPRRDKTLYRIKKSDDSSNDTSKTPPPLPPAPEPPRAPVEDASVLLQRLQMWEKRLKTEDQNAVESARTALRRTCVEFIRTYPKTAKKLNVNERLWRSWYREIENQALYVDRTCYQSIKMD